MNRLPQPSGSASKFSYQVFNTLRIRILFSLCLLIIFIGTGLYALIRQSVSDFRSQSIREELQAMSKTIETITERNLAWIPIPQDPGLQKQKFNQTLDIVKRVTSQNGFKTVIYKNISGTILMDNFGIGFSYVMVQDERSPSLQMLTQKTQKHYFYHFYIPSLQWHVILLKTSETRSALDQNINAAYVKTFSALVIGIFLLIVYFKQLIKNPIHTIIKSIKDNEYPTYKGIYEFEFLSENISDMMRSLSQIRKTLEEHVGSLKMMQEELSNKSQKLEFIFNNIPDAVVFLNPDRTIERYNQAAADMFAYDCKDGVGMNIKELYSNPDDFDEQGRRRYNPNAEETHEPYEILYKRRDGSTFLGKSVGVPLKDKEGKVLMGYLAVTRDIDEEKKLQDSEKQYKARLEQEVRERTEELLTLNQRLKENQQELEANLHIQQSISDTLLETTQQYQEAKAELEIQNTNLLATNHQLEDFNRNKEHLLTQISHLYKTQVASLKGCLERMKDATAPDRAGCLQNALRDVSKIEEILRPIHQIYFSEKAIQSKKVLVAQTIKRQQIITKQALGGTGVQLDIVETLEDGRKKLEQKRYDIIYTDRELIQLAAIAYEKDPTVKTVFTTSEDAPKYLPLLKEYPFLSNIVSRNEEDRTFTIKNILTTVSKLITNDLFGLEKYTNWGVEVQQRPIEDSSTRVNLVNDMEAYLEQLGIRKSIQNKCVMVAEELLMNTIYDAPVNAEGKPLYNHLSRTQRILLKPEEQGIFRYACDGMFIAISTQDPFGAFHRETILNYLERCYSSIKDPAQQGKGGAGRGLFQILETSDLLVINVKPKIKTEVIAIFNMNVAARSERTTSFHYFRD
ncbi:PAS domain-containing protein [Deltaproteobacteria bacterium TL4]